MNRTELLASVTAAWFCWSGGVGIAYSSSTGPPPGMAGVPAAGSHLAEQVCTACHNSFSLNPDKLGSVELLGVPPSYTPGARYKLIVKVSHPEATRWGFQLTAVTADGMAPAGDFEALPGDKSVQRVDSGTGTRVYVEHGAAGRVATGIGDTGSHSWKFIWIAPAQPAGEVLFFGAANAANGDGSPSGDRIYSREEPLARVAAGK